MNATVAGEPLAPITVGLSRGFRARMTLVLAFAALLFCAKLGERALWSEEVRWAEIPREMLTNSNLLWPTINGRSYYDKPLGSYWLVLAASECTGGIDETSARLPSALSGLLAVALAMLIARRLYDEDAAVWTGIILATSFSFVFFARNASTDVETIAGVLLVLWIFLRYEASPPGCWTLLLWLVMAATSLTKGLLGFVLPIMIIGLYSTLAPQSTGSASRSIRSLMIRNRWLFNRWSLAAIPLSTLVYLGPFLPSIVGSGSTVGLEMVYRENIRRFFDPVNHRGPVYLYAIVIFALMAPWSVLLPAALAQAHTRVGRPDRGRVFALAYFWGTFLFFTMSSSRRSYYLLPILPSGAFLIARLLSAREPLGRMARRLFLAGFYLTCVCLLLGIAALCPPALLLPEPWKQFPGLPCPWAFIAAWAVSIAAVGFTLIRPSPRRIASSFATIAVSFMIYLYLFALPATEVYRTQKPFANAVKQTTGSMPNQLALYRTREIVYYLDAPLPIAEYHTPEELRIAMRAHRLRWLLLRRRDWQNLAMHGRVLVEETIHPWESPNLIENKLLLVEVGVHSDP